MDVARLVKEAKQGSAAAQKCLFDLQAHRMLVLCRRYVKRHEDAEERLMDGFCKFFQHLQGFTYQGEAALFAWLKRIMINECLMFLRKTNVFDLSSEAAIEDIAIPEAALDAMGAGEIFELIVQLPVGYRTIFNLHVVEGMPHREIAALAGISEGTSKSQLSKARAMLQKLLTQKGISYGTQQAK